MQRDVEVVGARAVDRPVSTRPAASPSATGTRRRATVPQHEAEVMRSDSAGRAFARTGAAQQVAVGQPDATDRRQGHDRDRPSAAVGGETASQSAPRARTAGGQRRAVASSSDGGAALRGVRRHEGRQPRAELDAREAQALRLGVERGALRLPLGGELILEVFEEEFPAHPARLGH